MSGKGNCSKPSHKIPRSSSLSSNNDLDQIKKRLEKEKCAKQSNTASGEQHLKLSTDIYKQLMTLERNYIRKEDTTLGSIIEVFDCTKLIIFIQTYIRNICNSKASSWIKHYPLVDCFPIELQNWDEMVYYLQRFEWLRLKYIILKLLLSNK
jgi:hypothetical protein